MKFMLLNGLDQLFTAAPSADNGDVHFKAHFLLPDPGLFDP
ncbi:MAG: hypothetical protein P8185_19910 [Deltaproteobacteria bacterium]